MGRVDRRAATERIARLVVTEVELTARPLAQTAGNALRDDVDDTADGAAAIEQGGRPLQHFDLIGDQRIDADRMIVTQGRCVHRAYATFQNTHALTAQTADQRSARTGAEGRRAHAKFSVKSLAQGRELFAAQILVGDDDGGLRQM